MPRDLWRILQEKFLEENNIFEEEVTSRRENILFVAFVKIQIIQRKIVETVASHTVTLVDDLDI